MRVQSKILLVTKNGPYACGNFHPYAFTRFLKPQQLGRARIVCSSIVSSRAQAETTASTGKEDLKAVREFVTTYKEVGLQEWPLAG